MGVNLWGVVHGLLAFVPRMVAGGEGGHVVNTASMAGLIASQGLGVYNTTKYAVVGLSETLSKDLRPHGIGVTVVCPMGVATRIRQAGRNRPAALRGAPGASGASEITLIGRTLDGRRGRADAGCGPGRRALRDHARGGAGAAPAPLPPAGGRDTTTSTSLTPTRATAILSAEY
jgi:NAD(P)-dependent dehydrogenase (short-subunit alcohol dehydrogenase family)